MTFLLLWLNLPQKHNLKLRSLFFICFFVLVWSDSWQFSGLSTNLCSGIIPDQTQTLKVSRDQAWVIHIQIKCSICCTISLALFVHFHMNVFVIFSSSILRNYLNWYILLRENVLIKRTVNKLGGISYSIKCNLDTNLLKICLEIWK